MYLWLELSFFGGLKFRGFSIPISVDVHSKVGRALNFLFSSVAWLFLFASFLDVSLNSLSSFYILSFWLLHHERGVSSLPSCTHQSLIFVMTEFHPRTLLWKWALPTESACFVMGNIQYLAFSISYMVWLFENKNVKYSTSRKESQIWVDQKTANNSSGTLPSLSVQKVLNFSCSVSRTTSYVSCLTSGLA